MTNMLYFIHALNAAFLQIAHLTAVRVNQRYQQALLLRIMHCLPGPASERPVIIIHCQQMVAVIHHIVISALVACCTGLLADSDNLRILFQAFQPPFGSIILLLIMAGKRNGNDQMDVVVLRLFL